MEVASDVVQSGFPLEPCNFQGSTITLMSLKVNKMATVCALQFIPIYLAMMSLSREASESKPEPSSDGFSAHLPASVVMSMWDWRPWLTPGGSNPDCKPWVGDSVEGGSDVHSE